MTARSLVAFALLAGCAAPELPSRPPDLVGRVIAAGTAGDGTRGLAVELPRPGADIPRFPGHGPDPAAPIVTLDLEPGAASVVRDADGTIRRATPTAEWVGHTASVWIGRPMHVPSGVSFAAPAAAVVIERGPAPAAGGREPLLP